MKTRAIVHGPAIRSRLSTLLAHPRGRYLPLSIEGLVIGWVDDARAEVLSRFGDVFTVRTSALAFNPALRSAATRTQALDSVVETLAAEGRLSAWRNERYAIAPYFGAAPLCTVERAAARFFGIQTYAAHINGVLGEPTESMWLARRSFDKAIDPGMLDNLVGGGVPAGASVAHTVTREAWEEAGIPASIAATATLTGELRVLKAHQDGLQRETIFVHDLWLDRMFEPANQDGEAVEHRLLSLADAAALIACDRGADVVTTDASLVILDFLLRQGGIDPESPDGRALGSLRYASLDLTER